MVNIYAYDKTVYINIPDGFDNDAICTVFNMMGKKVISEKLAKGLNTVPAPFNKGFYVVTVNMGRGLVTEKVFY
ncbi:MAG: T9SS type A sorting domain-containing protein [Bacteroidales bacterium]|nr:T9SS type A sorting domain-containing protein [Bacteroidales bacterium]